VLFYNVQGHIVIDPSVRPSVRPPARLNNNKRPSNCKQNKREQHSSFPNKRVSCQWPTIKQKKIFKVMAPFSISTIRPSVNLSVWRQPKTKTSTCTNGFIIYKLTSQYKCMILASCISNNKVLSILMTSYFPHLLINTKYLILTSFITVPSICHS
jgi:hypothetical protein